VRTQKLYEEGNFKAILSVPGWADALHEGRSTTAVGAYLGSAWAFRAVGVRADAIASAPLKLYDGNGEVIERHPILDVLKNVNPEWNRGDLWRYTEAGLLVYGAGYWLKVRAGNQVRELFYLNPSTIKPEVKGDGIRGFWQTLENRRTWFPRQDIIYFRGAYDPTSDLTGIAALQPAQISAGMELSADRHLDAYFRNGAVPAVVLTTEQALQDSTIQKIRDWWNRLFRGPDNAHKMGVVGSGLKPVVLGSTIADMALGEVRQELHRTISTATGVPELLISPTNAADLTPVKMAENVFYNTTVMPRWTWYEEVLNAELLNEYEDLVRGDCMLRFDTSNIVALQESADNKAARLGLLVEKKIIRPEVAAVEMGYKLEDVPEETLTPTLSLEGRGGETLTPDITGETLTPDVSLDGRGGKGDTPGISMDGRGVEARMGLELERWQRKALRSLEKGKGTAVEFTSTIVPEALRRKIADGLRAAETAEDVKRVFAGQGTEAGRDEKAAGRDKREPGREEKEKFEQRLAALMKRMWRRQAEKIQAGVEAGTKAVGWDPEWDLGADDEGMADLVRLLMEATRGGIALFGMANGKLPVDWSLTNVEAARWAKEYAYELVRGIDEVTRKALQQAVSLFVEIRG
jgi:HK97 family phage portal protein